MLLPLSAQAGQMHDVVVDTRGQHLHDARGNCVFTTWESATDHCKGGPVSHELTIYFGFNSTALTDRAREKLDAIFRKVSNDAKVRSLRIVGYADEIGDAGYNKALSSRRALAVKNYLEAKGYAHTRVAKVRGLGEAYSRTNCEGIQNRREKIACLGRDRRVEIELEYHD